MYLLRNDSLTVSILDPATDQHRFGTRYCTGGYVFQIEDARLGPLLSGPTYPESFNVFDGQGIPDAFNASPLRVATATDSHALVLGVGTCDLTADTVVAPCAWNVEVASSSVRLRTQQHFEGFGVDLERTVSLAGRSVRSATRLENLGSLAVPIRWFPHPFFPQAQGTDELCRFNVSVTMPDNPSYALAENGFIVRRNFPWSEGRFQPLDHAASAPLVVVQKHASLGLVAATCSYVPGFLPIWGNARTFSWEPYFERTLAPGQAVHWWVDYDF